MALDKFQPYLFVSAGEQSNKYLTPVISPDGIASFQAQRAQDLTGLTVRIDPVQEGTGDPSPTNIRPISGRTGMTVTQETGNLLDGSVTWVEGKAINAQGQIVDNSGTRYSSLIPVENGKTYVLRFTGSGFVTRIHGYNASGTWVQQVKYGETSPQEFTISNSNVTAIRISTGRAGLIYVQSLVVRVNAIPITWQTEAGTIYGGTLDVVSGVLTVDRKSVDMGDITWSRTTSYSHPVFYTIINDKAASSHKAACSMFSVLDNPGIFSALGFANNAQDCQIASSAGNKQVYVRYDAITDAAAFQTAVTGQTLVYPLATPQTYQLTPTQVRTIAGYNQIFSDAGPVIDIKF